DGAGEPQRLALGAAAIAQVEPDVAGGGRAGLDRDVEHVADACEVVDADFDGVAGDVLARHAPSLRIVELLLQVDAERADRIPGDAGLREPLLDAGHRFGIQTLSLAGSLGARLGPDGHERRIGSTLHDGLAGRDDNVHRLLRHSLRGDKGQPRGDQAGHTILNPTLYAYVSGGTLCRYAHRSIATSSFTHEP